MKVLITGACGKCGTALRDLPHDKVFLDRVRCPDVLPGERFIEGDLGEVPSLTGAMDGCQALVHLAAASQPDTPWEQVLEDNIIGTQNAFQAAEAAGVDHVIFASSNHAVGMYELDGAPGIYQPGHGVVVDKHAPPRPDGYYGASKVFGEQLGRYFAEHRRWW